MVKIPHGQQSRKFSRIAHPDHQPKQREAARAVNLLLMKDESWLPLRAAPAGAGQYKDCFSSLPSVPAKADQLEGLSFIFPRQHVIHSQFTESEPAWSRAGKGSFAQCLPAAPPCLAELLLPRREKSSDPLRAAQWSIHKPERTIQLSNHGVSEIVLGSLHF